LKILHLSNYFFPEYSGTTTRLYNLLYRLPHEIFLINRNETIEGHIIKAQCNERFGTINVQRVSLRPVSPIFKSPPFRYMYTIYYKPRILVNATRKLQFDIIHAHDPLFFGQVAMQLSKKHKKKFIVELHVLAEDYIKGINQRFKHFNVKRVTNKTLKSCNHVISLTQALKDWISSHYNLQEDKITVVPNGADIDKFAPKVEYKKKAEELKKKLNITDSVVMYAGFMDRINGIVDLAKMAPWVIRERPSVFFVFIGHGPEEEELKALSKAYPKNVKFLPMVHYDEMPIYYQLCDLFIIPRPSTISAETVTPLKLLEAMAMEKPVLGSNVGGIAEIIKHGENGYLFEKGNMESFKKTLLEVLDADNTEIGKNARKTIIENYTWDKSAKILQKVYEDLV